VECARVGLWCGLVLSAFALGFDVGPLYSQANPVPPAQVAPSEVLAPAPTVDAAPGKDKKPAHWTVALQSFTSAVGSILLLAAYSALIVVAIFLIVFVWRELRKKIVIIEPFEVPPSVAATGLTGAALVTQIKQRIDEIRSADHGLAIRLERSADGRTAPPVEFRMETASDLIILEASAGGFSTRDVLLFLRKVFNRPPIKVTGHLHLRGRGAQLVVEVRMPHRNRMYEVRDEPLIQTAAERLLHDLDPGSVANYYASRGRLGDMEQVAAELKANEYFSEDFYTGLILSGYVALARLERDEGVDNAQDLYTVGELLEFSAPRSSAGQFYMGVAARHIPKAGLDEAVERLRRSVRYDRHNLQAHFYLGFVLHRNGKLNDALKKYEFVLANVTHNFSRAPNDCGPKWIWHRVSGVIRRRRPTHASPSNVYAGQALLMRALILGKTQGRQMEIDGYDQLIAWGSSINSVLWSRLVADAMFNKGVVLNVTDPFRAIAVYNGLIDRYGSHSEIQFAMRVARALIARTIVERVSAGATHFNPDDPEFQALVTEWQTRNPAVAAQLLPALQDLAARAANPPPEPLPGADLAP
jgi:tetratricopeptide (TPR) repeat protein